MVNDIRVEAGEEESAVRPDRHWSVRPTILFVLVLAAKVLINIFTVALTLLSTNPNQSPDFGFILAVDSAVALFALAVGAACFFPVRRAQMKHGLRAEAEWTTTKALWAGVALLAAYAALVLLRDVNEFVTPGLAAINLMLDLAVKLSGILLYFLLLPVAEARYGLVKSALFTGALVAVDTLLNRLIFTVAGSIQAAMVNVTLPLGSLFSISDILRIVSGFAYGVLVVAAYRLASRKLLGTWALYAALAGLALRLFYLIVPPMRSSQAESAIYYVLYFLYYLVIAALCLGVLAGYKKWSSLRAFAADLKGGILKLRGMRDDDET